MGWTRRRVLVAGAGLGGAAFAPGLGRASAHQVLRAAPGVARIGPADLPETAIWGYDGGVLPRVLPSVPGPVLRVRQGERLRVRLENALPQASTIHWHGIRIDNRMDGVAGLTQEATPPGQAFEYDFVAPDAGTFWYHPHNRSWEQVARGLYGALIVEEDAPPQVDRDLVLIVDDWRLDEAAAIHETSFGALMDWSHAGRQGNWLTVNGEPQPVIAAKRNERLRLRLINSANAAVLPLRLDGADGWIVALDGQPVRPTPFELIPLAPAQRADVIVDISDPEKGRLMVVDRGEYPAASIAVSGEARPERLDAPPPLAPNPLPALDLAGAEAVELVMEGGAMGGLQSARIGGRAHRMDDAGAPLPEGPMPLRELAGRGFVWALNGVAGMPETPLFQAAQGRAVRLRIVNDTAWPHAMHLHGHHFRVLSRRPMQGAEAVAGIAVTALDAPDAWRDTVLTAPGETVEIGFTADNPGDWMIHCHMLEHQAAGMGTWFRVG